ncbi:MAG: hypothetical protein JNK87_34345 [Bryobacterales bacterium]|nr:hypothetical protein [Bryobacterales bacterium]
MASHIYRLPLFVRLLYISAAVVVFALGMGTYLTVTPSIAATNLVRAMIVATVPVSLLGAACMVAYAYRARLELTQESLTFRGLLRSRELRAADIAAWRTREHLEIHTTDGVLRVARSLVLVDEVLTWLERFPNLDDIARQQELAEIARTAPDSLPEAETLANLARAERASWRLNLTSWILVFWLLLYPVPFLSLACLTALAPWIAVLCLRRHRGYLQVAGEQRQLRPMLMGPILLPGAAMSMTAMINAPFTGFGFMHALLIAVATAPLVIAVLWADPSARRSFNAVFLPVFLLMYGGGAVTLGNALLDDTVTAFHARSIRGKPMCAREYPGAFGLPWRNAVPCTTGARR